MQHDEAMNLMSFHGEEEEEEEARDISYYRHSHQQEEQEEDEEEQHRFVHQEEDDESLLQPLPSEQHDGRKHDESELMMQVHPLQLAEQIVRRYRERGDVFPSKEGDVDEQEYRDAALLDCWKQAHRDSNGSLCPIEVVQYLDKEIPNWKEVNCRDMACSALQKAKGIVQRYIARGRVFPRDIRSGGQHNIDPATRKQESQDASKLNYWKLALKSPSSRQKCPDSVKQYLDANLPGWTRNIRAVKKEPMDFAIDIVARYVQRGHVLPREFKNRRGDPEREQEYRDATKLRNWKKAIDGRGTHMCTSDVVDYLDSNMPGWRKPKADKVHLPLTFAKEIVARCRARRGALPRELKDTKNDPVRIQEYKDACKLNNWRKSLRGIGSHNCPEHIQAYLDEHLPNWRTRGVNNTVSRKRPRESDMDDLGMRSVCGPESIMRGEGLLLHHEGSDLASLDRQNSESEEHSPSGQDMMDMGSVEASNIQQSIMQNSLQTGLGSGMEADMDADDMRIVNVLTAQI